MSKDSSFTDTSSLEEDTLQSQSLIKPHLTSSDTDIPHSGIQPKRRSKVAQLQQDTLEALNVDSNILHSGSRLLRSQKTLFLSDEDKIRKQLEYDRLVDEEFSLRPCRAGQTTQDRYAPTRADFEYIYKNIDDLECQTWASDLESWVNFIRKHNIFQDPSLPILDKNGLEYPDLTFSLDTLLQLPGNKKYLKKKTKKTKSHDLQTSSAGHNPSNKDLSDPPRVDPSSSSSSSSSFVVLHHKDILESGDNNSQHDSSQSSPVPSTGVTPTTTPQGSPPRTPPPQPAPLVVPIYDSDSESEMTSLREKSVFFPSQKFDGRNKNLTKQHWQSFEDFCNQQKLYIEDTRDTAAASIDDVQTFFQMTLTDLARAWLERQTFTTPKDLKEKFLTDFSPYGKTHRQWIATWTDLKFNPDTDNIDEFLEKFEDLATLNNIQNDHKLHAFKISMPKEVELHLNNINNLQDCYQTAKDLLTIVQNSVTNKMSTLSLVQSRSPSPQPRSRSPSPISSRPPPERFRPRTRPNFTGFKKYPGPNQPQSIMKRQPRIHYSQGRGPSRMRPRSLSRPRSYSGNRMPPLRCFICNMIGHIARNCFTKTRPHPQNRQNFPRRFTRNFRGRQQRQVPQGYQPPRVRFQDQYNPQGQYNPTGQGRDGRRYQPPRNARYRPQTPNPNAYSDQEDDEYYEQNQRNFDRYLN